MSSKLPRTVANLCTNFNGFIIGSAANPRLSDEELLNVRDFDIAIPWYNWHKAVAVVPSNATPNIFGGWKFQADGVEIDLWPSDLHWALTNCHIKFIWSPSTKTHWTRYGQ